MDTSVSWEIWYHDTFDRDSEPSCEARGEGLVAGFGLLWRKTLEEAVLDDGRPTFTDFTLHVVAGSRASRFSIPRDPLANPGLGRLRGWREVAGLVERVARAHLALAERGGAAPILRAAFDAGDPADLLARLDEIAPDRPRRHWKDREEPAWAKFRFGQPYAKGLERLRREVLSRPDFDPAVLWQWGTMQAMAVVEILRSVEERFGADGQRVVGDALRRVGRDIGRQILESAVLPDGVTDAEVASFFATVINRIAYASIEQPRIEDESTVSFDIVWCPHQDHYCAFDCRVQRYLVQGMIDAARELSSGSSLEGWEVRFDSTIPSGSPTCHFTMWKATGNERAAWTRFTELLEAKALARARRDAKS